MTNPPPTAQHIFISYARRDGRDLALRLQADLSAAHFEVWLDTSEIEAGASWSSAIEDAIERCDIALILLSHGAYTSEICRAEQLRALRKDKRVIPLLVQVDAERPLHLEHLNYRDFTNTARYAESLQTLLNDLSSNSKATPLPENRRQTLVTAPALPPQFVARPEALDQLRRAVLGDEIGQSVALTALRGMGGIGKSVLAIALCHDEVVQAAFPDGVLWVSIGREPGSLIEHIREIGTKLGDSAANYSTEASAITSLRALLPNKAALIVLDDVWDAAHIDSFRINAPRCRTLLTTRSGNVALALGAEEVRLGTLNREQSAALLREWSKRDDPLFAEVAERLGNLPLALKLAGARLREGMTSREWLDTFQHVSQMKLGRRSSTPDENLEVCFDLSVQQIPEEDRLLYHTFGIFPEDLAIPQHVVIRLWRALEPGLTDYDCAELLVELARLALIERDTVSKTVTLHDLLHDYTRTKLENRLLPTHEALLGAYNPAGDAWYTIPDDGYLYDNLAYHLRAVGHSAEFTTTVQDLRFLVARTWANGVTAAERDLIRAEILSPDNRHLQLLTRNFINMEHILSRCETMSQIAETLDTRLQHLPEMTEMCSLLHATLYTPRVEVWHTLPDLPHPALIRTLTGHTDDIRSCSVSSNNKFIVSGSRDEMLKVWDVATGRERLTLRGHTAPIGKCVISPDDKTILSCSWDNTLKAWDVATGRVIATLMGHTGRVRNCVFSSDGASVVSASDDGTLKVWSTSDWAERFTLRGHQAEVDGCDISPDNRYIVSASWDGTLKIWDAEHGQEIQTIRGHTGQVRDCKVSKNGQFIVSGGDDGAVKVWNFENGQERISLIGHTSYVVRCVISSDDRVIFSASRDETLKAWSVEDGQELFTLRGHAGWVSDCALSTDNHFIVTSSEDRTLKIWDIDTARTSALSKNQDEYLTACAISPNAQFVITASLDQTLKRWDIEPLEEKLTFIGHKSYVYDCTISSDSQVVVSASYDGTLKTWNATNGLEVHTFRGQAHQPIFACAISSDEKLIVCGIDHALHLWNVESGLEVGVLIGHIGQVRACTISPSNQFIVSASRDNLLKIWDIASRSERQKLVGHTDAVTDCVVSSDNYLVVSASRDTTLKIWDITSGVVRKTLSGHTDAVNGCSISPKNRFIASASADKTLKIWEIETGKCLATFYADGKMKSCDWHPDGEHIIACGDRGLYWLRFVQ